MRIRTVKPSFFKDAKLYQLEQSTGMPMRVAYEGLWCAADRRGVFKWEPEELKADILPFDDLDFLDVLIALEGAGFIMCFQGPDGGWFGFVLKFSLHQYVNPQEKPSGYPVPGEELVKQFITNKLATREWRVPDASRTRPERAETPYRTEGKGREGEGREGKGREEITPPTSEQTSLLPPTSPAPSAPVVRARSVLGTYGLALPVGEIAAHINHALNIVSQETDARRRREAEIWLKAEFVFAYWAHSFGHTRSKYDPQGRGRYLRKRLVENDGDIGELLFVVDGAQKDDFLMGREPGKPKVHDAIETLFRDRGQVERLANMDHDYRAGKPHRLMKETA